MTDKTPLTAFAKRLFLAAGVLAVLGLSWFFLLHPVAEGISRQRDIVVALKSDIAGTQEILDLFSEVEEEYQALRQKEVDTRVAPIHAAELPQVLRDLEQLLNETSVDIKRFVIGGVLEGEIYHTIPVFISAEGHPDLLLALLSQLEHFEHMTFTREISLQQLQERCLMDLKFDLIVISERRERTMGQN